MALSFGWRPHEVRESIWREDPALANISAAALASWREDGEAMHLRPFESAGKASIITFRNLTPDEARMASAYWYEAANNVESWGRATLVCFRIGVDFPGEPEEIQTPDQIRHPRVVKERGVRMLAPEFISDLETRYPGMVAFYGGLIYRATYPEDAVKKASSPPSTQTPSSVAASTTAIMEPSPAPEAASGVQ